MYICLSLGVGRDCESPAKTVEPSEMPFGLWCGFMRAQSMGACRPGFPTGRGTFKGDILGHAGPEVDTLM